MQSAFQNTIVHPRADTAVDPRLGRSNPEWSARHVDTARRLIAAYKEAMKQEAPLKQISEEDLWTALIRDNFGALLDWIRNDDAEQLSRFLIKFGSDYTWFGGITTGDDGYTVWDRSDASVAYAYFDKLVCLAEAIGVLPVENPELGPNGNWGRNTRIDPAEIVARIEAELGIPIVPPQDVVPVSGLQVGDGLLHYRHLNALYLAIRLRDLTSERDWICEFGGGLGLAAFYLSRLGRRNVTVFDIPIVNLLAGHFLIGALGEDAVRLEGETPRPDTIRLLAHWNCAAEADDRFEIIANQDSFPEINRVILDEYARQIRRLSARYFLSINHESDHPTTGEARHVNVSTLLKSAPGFRRIYRAPYWLRRGYAEELYEITK